MQKSKVLARLTIEREVGVKTIIEVHADATFSRFYHFYTQDGRRRSTKKHIRQANRNEGLHPWYAAYRAEPGLEVFAKRFRQMPNVKKVSLRIIRRRDYRKALEAAPDELGLTRSRIIQMPDMRHRESGTQVYIPSTFTTLKKRFEIITGR